MTTDNEITPGRTTSVVFDLAETSLIESAFSVTRAGAEIAKDVALGLANDTPDDPNARHANVIHWSTGAITLRPLQQDISNLTEGTVCIPYLISVPANQTQIELLTTVAIIATENKFTSATDLPDFSASANIQPQGDPFLVKHIPAGHTYNNVLTDSQPAPEFVTKDIPVDRVGYSTTVYPENQGFFIRWQVPGSDLSVHGYTWAFYFGQYGLCLTGTGLAELWEYCLNTGVAPGQPGGGPGGVPSSALQWKRRATWRYAKAGQLSNTSFSMGIFPHSDPHGRRYISFTNNQLDAALVASQFERTGTTHVAPGEFVYNIDQGTRSPYERDESPGFATKAAIIRYDVRRDLDVQVQFSTLAWPTSGFLIDLPANIPPFSDPSVGLYAHAVYQSPPNGGLVATLLSAADNASPFVIGSTPGPAVRFDFYGDGSTTPILWKYILARNAVTTVTTPGAFTSRVASVSVSGVSGDASQDSAEVLIHDTAASLPRLRTRGRLSASLVVTDATGPVVLHRGYANRPHSVRHGRAGRVFPAPDWREITVPMAGMALRLSEKYQGPTQRKFTFDTSTEYAADGTALPWRVTDVIYQLLHECGYTDAQINIPDQEVRIWNGETVKADDVVLDASGNYFEYMQRLVRDMLGAYLIFDQNAGPLDTNGLPLGWWTLLYQTPYPAGGGQFTPVFSFVTQPPSQNSVQHALSAYPAGTAPIIGRVEFENIPPEDNAVLVTTAVSQAGTPLPGATYSMMYNYASYQAPGSGVTLDPNNPDYLGYEKLYIYVDSTLGADTNEQGAQAACDWVARRVFSFACHAQQLLHFTAPLVFITDPGGYRRPLRFQDPISINGNSGYLVKACHPHYDKDGFQLAEYEVINPMPQQMLQPGIESLSFYRNAQGDHARHSTGAQTGSQRDARKTLPAHREQQHLELPCLLSYQSPLQDPSTGNPFFMLGFDSLGSLAIR